MGMEFHIHLRPVTPEDEDLLFEWRNDVEARLNSRHPAPISSGEHSAWFGKSMHGDFPGRVFCIAEDSEGNSIGVVRADPRDDGSFEISYSVAPEWRGRGIAKEMTHRFVESYMRGKKMVAIIRQGSIASEKVAESLGLTPYAIVPSEHEGDDRIFREWK